MTHVYPESMGVAKPWQGSALVTRTTVAVGCQLNCARQWRHHPDCTP